MNLPISPRTMDAICLEHVLPTTGGTYLFNAPSSSLAGDEKLRDMKDIPVIRGYGSLTFGIGLGDPILSSPVTVMGDDGVPRPARELSPQEAQALDLARQYLRSLPPEALDILSNRPADSQMTLDQLAEYADKLHFQAETALRRLIDAALTINPNRLLYLDGDGRPVIRERAAVVKVAPIEHRAPNPFADVDPSLRELALSRAGGYPSARIVFDAGGRVQLGMPPALVRHLESRTSEPAPSPRVPDGITGPERFGMYNDLMARIAEHHQEVRIEVRARGGQHVETFKAVHDEHGIRFTDPRTGEPALFPAETEMIQATAWDPADLAAVDTGTAVTPLPIVRPKGLTVHRTYGPDDRLSVDVLGARDSVPANFLDQVAGLGADAGRSVVVVGHPAGKAEAARDLARAQSLLFQRAWNLQHGRDTEPMPMVIDYGGVGPELSGPAAALGAPVLRRELGTGLDIGVSWRIVGADGVVAGTAQKGVPQDTSVWSGTPVRANPALDIDRTMASYLSMSMDDVPALVAALTVDGSTLKSLRPAVDALPVDPRVFAPQMKLLDLLDTADGRFEAGIDYLRRVEGGTVQALPDITKVLHLGTDALDDLAALTLGTMDDGASRSILAAIRKGIEGVAGITAVSTGDQAADGAAREQVYRQMRDEIFAHKDYLPGKGSRTDYVRALQGWAQQLEEHRDVLSQAALYVTTCP
ncbi:hypothetical protein [Catenuloplanes indicus]|uniref:Uncharacterized protein n=1 Tax=Catenuloplanes indicus TaxID=137267 RepID=A0AAE3W5M4_9ACTN|nr:hypothetical protein [Catenuloplanes indicus]MDQ0370011.1 hypothetical protein [Catenuloplanes indicus]